MLAGGSKTFGSSTNATATATVSTTTEVDGFKKGIKRDIPAYDKITCDTQYCKWFESFCAAAHSQDLQDVVDPNYVPTGHGKVALFTLQNRFVYLVCGKTMKTPEALKIVRKYKLTQDAQKVFAEYMRSSTKSADRTFERNIMVCVSSVRILYVRWSPIFSAIPTKYPFRSWVSDGNFISFGYDKLSSVEKYTGS